MELELKHQVLEGYRPVYRAMLGQEETLESIVPDSFPDMARIVSATGTACLKEKEAGAGTVRLTGGISVTILYIPETEEQVRSLRVMIPFQCVKDCPHISENTLVQATVSVASSDARILNPRKLLVRSSVRCAISAYEKEKRELTCDAVCQDNCMEKQFSQHSCYLISEIVEKPFLFSDVLRQAAAKPVMEELLLHRAELGTLDGKVIGKKLVCKGEILLSVLYRSGISVVPARFELPYSQIIELTNEGEEDVPELALVLKNVDCRLRDGELEVSVEALVQSSIWTQRPVTVMSDVYCTSCTLEVERNPHECYTKAEHSVRRETARQFCPSGIPGKQVLDCCTAVGSIGQEGQNCSAELNVDILYLSEDNALCGVSYTIPVTCEVPMPENGTCQCMCRPFGESSAVPVTGGLEVRAGVEFSWTMTQEENVLCVTAVKGGTEIRGDAVRPSVVIRRVGDNESLWEIAKSCGSTIKDICTANALLSESVPNGTVLLIPVKKA